MAPPYLPCLALLALAALTPVALASTAQSCEQPGAAAA
jgi:hypothetical protein